MLDTDRDIDIDTLSNFQRKTADFMRQMKQSGEPIVLTVDGKAEFVVQDAQSYQALMDRLQQVEDLSATREGLAQAERGEGRPVREVFAEIKERHDIG